MDKYNLARLQYEYGKRSHTNLSKKQTYIYADSEAGKVCDDETIYDTIERLGGTVHWFSLDEIGYFHCDVFLHEDSFDIIMPNFFGPLRSQCLAAELLAQRILRPNVKNATVNVKQDSRILWEGKWWANGYLFPTRKLLEKIKAKPAKELTYLDIGSIRMATIAEVKYRLKTFMEIGV